MKINLKDAIKLIAKRVKGDSKLTQLITKAEQRAWKSSKWNSK